MLNHIVGETVRKDFARERRYGDPGGLALQNVAEVLEIAVSAADTRVFQLERWNIGLRES